MKKIFTGLAVIAFGIVLLAGVARSVSLTKYNDSLIPGSVAEGYIAKNVNGSNEEIIYGETENPETGSANMVTSVIANYRSLDTLGEVTVLFLAAVGVSLLTSGRGRRRNIGNGGFILIAASRILFPVMLITGI
ncbi:MAG: cation:proton antiporter, partial [Clostridia bacterium]|nr:cation:proton antiporter [Clostridia bacterium]